MITYDKILEFSDGLAFGSHDYPFEGDFYSAVLRRKDNGKWFGIILKAPSNYFKRYGAEGADGTPVLNLKCPPDLQLFLRDKYADCVFPSYHMSKTKWISVILDGEMPEEEMKRLIELSYDLTAGGGKRKA